MINLPYIGRKEPFPSREDTYSTLSTLFHQFHLNLELSECIKGSNYQNLQQNIVDHYLSMCFPSYHSITLLYCYYFLNSVYLSSNEKFKGTASTKVRFKIVSTVNFTQVSL